MARKKLSEYRAKYLVNEALRIEYIGWQVNTLEIFVPELAASLSYVVKVDQAIKQRLKRGLIKLNVSAGLVGRAVRDLSKKGHQYFLIEPYVQYDTDERYLSMKRDRSGVLLSYSGMGGVEIESHADTIQTGVFENLDLKKIAVATGLSELQLRALYDLFNENYLSLLEINPYTVTDKGVVVLDVAIEVDSSAAGIVPGWSVDDIRTPATTLTKEEIYVKKINEDSPASLSLEVMNPNGSIFLLLSGGGASVVIADEIFNLGKGAELANYGEYSGNPNEEETRLYAEQVLALTVRSTAKNKVVFIGGAVANFTDIAVTFNGIIAALKKHEKELREQKVKIYVRRGGPRQSVGLKAIHDVLKEIDILGGVYDPQTSIPSAVKSLLKGLDT